MIFCAMNGRCLLSVDVLDESLDAFLVGLPQGIFEINETEPTFHVDPLHGNGGIVSLEHVGDVGGFAHEGQVAKKYGGHRHAIVVAVPSVGWSFFAAAHVVVVVVDVVAAAAVVGNHAADVLGNVVVHAID